MNTGRVDRDLFRDDHYLGKPADDEDRIIQRRIEVLERYPEFFNRNMSLVEAGCGSGATVNRIAHRFNSCLGIDIFDYSSAFEHSRTKYSAVNSRFLQLDLEKESTTQTFDRLISFEVIEHLKDENSIAAYYKILNNGGMAAITVPNKWWIFETHGARLPLLPWNRVPFFSWLPRSIHEKYANARIYSRQRITRLLKKHGFTIIDSAYITAPMDVIKNKRLQKLLTTTIFKDNTTTIPLLSTAIFILAQKQTAK